MMSRTALLLSINVVGGSASTAALWCPRLIRPRRLDYATGATVRHSQLNCWETASTDTGKCTIELGMAQSGMARRFATGALRALYGNGGAVGRQLVSRARHEPMLEGIVPQLGL